jgi:glycerol-3-phosphate O-acyltransferase
LSRNELALPSKALSRTGILGRAALPLFERVRVDRDALERLTRAHTEGAVVHVIRSSRLVDPMFVLWLCDAVGIPGPIWMHDHFAGRADPEPEALRSAILAGEPTLLFLRRPRTLIQPKGAYAEPLVETLISLQQKLDRPILLFPESLQYHRRASGLRRTLLDAIFGNRESPGRIRELLGFLVGFAEARFHLGAPLNLQELLAREGDAPALVIV